MVPICRGGAGADGQLWIAMQHVKGADAALRAGAMTPARALRISAR